MMCRLSVYYVNCVLWEDIITWGDNYFDDEYVEMIIDDEYVEMNTLCEYVEMINCLIIVDVWM